MFVGVEKIRLSHVGSNFTRKMLISVTAVVNTKAGFVDDRILSGCGRWYMVYLRFIFVRYFDFQLLS